MGGLRYESPSAGGRGGVSYCERGGDVIEDLDILTGSHRYVSAAWATDSVAEAAALTLRDYIPEAYPEGEPVRDAEKTFAVWPMKPCNRGEALDVDPVGGEIFGLLPQ